MVYSFERTNVVVNEVFISVLARIAYKLIVSFNIERARNIVIWQEARYEMSETEIITVKIPTALASKIQIH